MAVRSTDIRSGPAPLDDAPYGWGDLNWGKLGALPLFALSVMMTKEIPAWLAPWFLAWPAGVLIQLWLTKLEGPIFRRWRYDEHSKLWVRREIRFTNWAALFADGVINALGVWEIVSVLHEAPFMQRLAAMLGGTTQPLEGLRAFGFCVAVGILIAAGFDRLYFDDEYNV